MASVDRTESAHGERPAQPSQLRQRSHVWGGRGDDVRQVVPTASASARVGDTGTDMPAARGGPPGGRAFVRMKSERLLSAEAVPLDPVAALAASVALASAR